MNYVIVADSSSNNFQLPGANYVTVPLKINAGDREFVDNDQLPVQEMIDYLKGYKGKSGTSCPNVQEWLDAFGDADYVFGITITKNLSGSYNAAIQAAEVYMEEHPGRRVHIFDSLSAGPELMMIAEKIQQCLDVGDDFDTVCEKVHDYADHNHTLFCLECMTNLARNGRVSPAAAKIAGLLGIRAVGAAEGGTIVPSHKPRGAKKAQEALVGLMKANGFYDGAILRVAHCNAESQALALRDAVLSEYPNTKFHLEKTTGLCSFYAEEGGLMIGYQGAYNKVNNSRDF